LRIHATRVLSAGLRQRWFDRLRRSLLSNWDPEWWCSCDISWHARARSARFDNAQTIIRCGEPVQLPLFKRIFGRNRTEEPAIADGRLQGLRDDEGMPLICPTCQLFFRSIHAPAGCLLLCMGLFSIFSGALVSTSAATGSRASRLRNSKFATAANQAVATPEGGLTAHRITAHGKVHDIPTPVDEVALLLFGKWI